MKLLIKSIFNTCFLLILLSLKLVRVFYMIQCRQWRLAGSRDRYLFKKKKKISQGGKHNFPKSPGVEGVHPRSLEEFQEAAELNSCVTY